MAPLKKTIEHLQQLDARTRNKYCAGRSARMLAKYAKNQPFLGFKQMVDVPTAKSSAMEARRLQGWIIRAAIIPLPLVTCSRGLKGPLPNILQNTN